jgi:hypothetical protein
MATTSTFTAVAAVEPVFTEPERLALAGFLAGYAGLTREAYALDLRQFASWCQQHHIGLFLARRADIECFARDLEARGRARATITRRLCTVAGFYRYAVEEELLDHSPAAHVRRPRLDYESHLPNRPAGVRQFGTILPTMQSEVASGHRTWPARSDSMGVDPPFGAGLHNPRKASSHRPYRAVRDAVEPRAAVIPAGPSRSAGVQEYGDPQWLEGLCPEEAQ